MILSKKQKKNYLHEACKKRKKGKVTEIPLNTNLAFENFALHVLFPD